MLTICYQFKNLQVYFYNLEDIFSDGRLSQDEKEVKYEEAFKVGIQMHSLTLWWVNILWSNLDFYHSLSRYVYNTKNKSASGDSQSDLHRK